MKIIIPSYQRPAQLYLLLESLERFGRFEPIILYKNDPKFYDGYLECNKKFNIALISEQNFKNDLIYYIPDDNICIACDDNFLYRNVPEIPNLKSGEVFSLRLGLNISMQNYATNERLPMRTNFIVKNNILSWNPVGVGYYNWEYPFSLDFHIYNGKQFKRLAESINFNNTNTLEGNLMKYRNQITVMYCPKYSCGVNWPLNNLSGLTTSQNVSLNSIYNKFMSGYKISLDSLIKENIIGCHQLFNLEWTKR